MNVYILVGILGGLSLLFSLIFFFYTRRRVSDKVEQQMDFYGKIIDSMPFPVMLKDINDNFRYIYWNKPCDELSGFDRNEVLRKTDFEIYGKEKGRVLRNKDLEVVRTGEPYQSREEFITPDGVIHDTVVSKVLLSNEYYKWLLVVRWDVTDLVEVQRSLALANKQLHLAFSSGNITPWIWDISNNMLYLGMSEFKDVNNGFAMDKDGVTLDFVLEHTHPDDKVSVAKYFNDLKEGKIEKANFVIRYDVNRNFDNYYNIFCIVESFDKNGNAKKVIGSMQNITEQKNFERELIIANSKIEQVNETNSIILDNTDIGLVYLTPDYMVQWENVSKYSDHPIARNYKVGSHCYKNVKNLHEPCPGCIMQKALLSKKREVKEIIFGGDVVAQIVASPVFDDSNNCHGVVLKVKDITEDRRRESDLREAKERAEKSDKLKSAFLANMSHEIRTPLNSILGFSELLSASDDPEEKEKYLQIINSNNELLLQLINDILDLSKIEADTLEFVFTDVDANEMMSDLERSFKYKTALNKDVLVEFEKQLDDGMIHTDRNRLQQVVSNFITNALKFTDEGRVSFGCERRGENIYFYVTDTGMGIPEEKLDDIFKRFTKLNNFKTGTGLGLTICQTIVRKLKGEIGVESELGKGSTFWFTMPWIAPKDNPVLVADEVEEKRIPKVSDGMNNRRPTILVAEDVVDNFKLYEAILGDKYTLLHAWNGIEAVVMFEEHRPSAILMDIKMPEMDGYEATEAIRALDKQVPIIAVTAFAADEDKKRISTSGFTDCLAKPVRSQSLLDVLDKFNI